MTMALVFIRCSDDAAEKSEEQLELKDAFVIGFDQCARYQGRILAIVNPPDTVITYNFPDSVYDFPDEYYSNYLIDCLFPSEAFDSYPIKESSDLQDQRNFRHISVLEIFTQQGYLR